MKKGKILAVGLIALVITLAFATCEQPTDPVHIHQWGEYVVTIAATCVAKGEETRTCTLDTTHKETCDIEINPDAHNYQNFVQTTAPLCETDGVETGICTYENTHICTRPITSLGHDWEDWDEADVTITLQPTCTTAGNGKRSCLRNGCDSEDSAEGNIPALGHDYQNWIQMTAPTCTAAGVETGTCTHDSSHTTTRPEPPIGHDYQNWIETTAPTCTTAGVETGTCTHDATHTDTRSVAVNPDAHNYQWITIAPSFIEEGIDKEICSRCSVESGNMRNAVPALLITTTAEWDIALTQLNGKTGSYTLIIDGSFSVAGNTDYYNSSFGTTSESSTLSVTLNGSGTLSLSNNDNYLLLIRENQTLIIDSADLILQGVISCFDGSLKLQNGTISNNTGFISFYKSSGVLIWSGTFTMSGGEISGNTSIGVYVSGGTFNMSGGEISGNTGSGVYVDGIGTFNMSGGKISGNTGFGGGVHVNSNGIGNTFFNMSGGEISGNTSTGFGGGVLVIRSGIFTMSGGEIFGNTATFPGGAGVPTYYKYGSAGGGVCIIGTYTYRENDSSAWSGDASFYKTGGTIHGNMVKNSAGALVNNQGHQVWAYMYNMNDRSDVIKRKETTAGPEVNLSLSINESDSTFSGEWDN